MSSSQSVCSSKGSKVSISPVTHKPWFLTCFDGEVFPWKDGTRLKLRNGDSAGRVRAISVLNDEDGTVTLNGSVGDGSQQYKLNCVLSKFLKSANSFCSLIASTDPYEFCQKLAQNSDLVDESACNASKKRKRIEGGEGSTKAKKQKPKTMEHDPSPYHIGTFSIPISALKEPPANLKVRDVKTWYVEYLADALTEDDREEIASPLLVICSLKKSEFKPEHVGSYSYQVIGGVQRFHALKIISERGEGMADRRCVVYGHGLSQAAALTLAQHHNETNQLQRATTFSEITGTCRRLIFSEFGEEQEDCADGSMPIIPRYNTQSYRDFKAKCLAILVNTQTSTAMVEQAIQMALQPSSIYHKMQQVFQMYEECSLKGQKCRELTGLTMLRALEGRYAAKLTQFKIFQGLKDPQKISLLDQLIDGSMSWAEAEKESTEMKSIETLKETFCKHAGCSREEVEKYTDVKHLRKFKVMKGKALPPDFKMYCDRAMSKKSNSSPEEMMQCDSEMSRKVEDPLSDEVVIIADEDSLMELPKNTNTIFYNMTEVSSDKQLTTGLRGLSIILMKWMCIFYNASISTESVKYCCKKVDAKIVKSMTICSLLKSESGVQLGSSKEIVIACWGDYHYPLCTMSDDINTIVVDSNEGETIICSQSTTWIECILRMCEEPIVADMFSTYGEAMRFCFKEDIECICVQRNKGCARNIAEIQQSIIQQKKNRAGNIFRRRGGSKRFKKRGRGEKVFRSGG